MVNEIFNGVTAVATTVGAVFAVIHFLRELKKSASVVNVSGRGYLHYEGNDFASLSVSISASKPVYIKTIQMPGRTLATTVQGKKVKTLEYGISFGKHRPDINETFYFSPPPQQGESIVLKFDIGQFFDAEVELNPTDFTSSGWPDRGVWPIDRSSSSTTR